MEEDKTSYEHFSASLCLCVNDLLLAATTGCRQDMHDQPKYIPLRPSEFFADGRSQRPLVEGTVARGLLKEDTAFYQGKGADGKPVTEFPFPVTKEVILRGQEALQHLLHAVSRRRRKTATA